MKKNNTLKFYKEDTPTEESIPEFTINLPKQIEGSIAISNTVGTIKPGNDFDIDSDGTLTLYKNISITSFSNNVNTIEKGKEITNIKLRSIKKILIN